MDPIPLTQQNLADIPTEVTRPSYDRRALTAGIAHIGLGGFARSHLAAAVDALMQRGEATEWGICGIGLRPSSRASLASVRAQDGLYTLVEKHPDGQLSARVIGSVIDYIVAPDDPEAALEFLADANTRIVSLTITEGGYKVNQVTGVFDATAPEVVQDAEAAVPGTVFGYVVEALRRRRDRGIPPFTVMSCDNLPGNGAVAREAFVSFARLKDSELAEWIEQHVSFPNSMVDRITPVTTSDDRAALADRFGIADAWPVVAEPFFQWVLEDAFTLGRPAFENADVQLVDDVEPYEQMKLRMLNGAHQALAYPGYLMGYRLVHEAIAEPVLDELVLQYMLREALPTVPPVPGIDIEIYARQLVERFSNPGVRDTLARLCAETSDRIPKFMLPVVRDQLRGAGDVELTAAVVACWRAYCRGVDENGEHIDIVDPLADRLIRAANDDARVFIADAELFGELGSDERFEAAFERAAATVREHGVKAALSEALASTR